MFKTVKKGIREAVQLFCAAFFLSVFFCVALCGRAFAAKKNKPPRLVWGSSPIINYSHWSRAMKQMGHISDTFVLDYFSSINHRNDWDMVLLEKYWPLPRLIKPYMAFLEAVIKYDIFIMSFDGFFLGDTYLRYFQAYFLKLANKKTVLIPYGSDAYVYSRVKSIPLLHGLMISFPEAAKKQERIGKNIDYWLKHADVVIPGVMGIDGFGRWDVLAPSSMVLDLDVWKPSSKSRSQKTSDETIVVVHAPNHRGFKGTEFIIAAIEQLKKEGLKIELRLLEKLQNSEVRRILNEEADILIEQLIITGHGINAIEGMANGLPTISNLEDENYVLPMRRWSYLGECPLVSATPETLKETLRKLVYSPQLRYKLGKAGRSYVEKYHSYEAAQYLFSNVIDYVNGDKDDLINLYHPLIGEYPNRSPKIQHPLVNNRIIDE